MLIYKSLKLIKKNYFYFVFIFFFSTNLKAKSVEAVYDIKWNNLVIGSLVWEFKLNEQNYEFKINLKNSDFLSKIYPFYGEYYSKGLIKKTNFIPEKYYSIWDTKKKKRVIKIFFANQKVFKLFLDPEQKIDPYINYYNLFDTSDPISASLELIINNDGRLIKNVFDGRRVYNISSGNGVRKNFKNKGFSISGFEYDVEISKYKNVWKDNNKKDLKKITVLTGEFSEGLILPISFKITSRGIVLKIIYKNHQNLD